MANPTSPTAPSAAAPTPAASTAASSSSLRFPGLSAAQVEESRRQHGANILTPPEREPWWKLWLEKFEDPVIRILIIAAVIAIAVGLAEGQFAEGVGIMIAILLATTLAFLNEYRANREFDILNRVNDEVPIKVIREGQFTTTPRKDLVVGDLAFLEIGEEAPADGQVLEAVSFQVDESRLTGESMPATKMTAEVAAANPPHETTYPADRVLRGTMVVDGHGIVKITNVGDATEIGKTARAAAEETDEPTPLNQQLERLSKLIGVVGLGVAGLTFLALLIRGVVVGEIVLSAGQWVFVGLLITGVMIALVRVWLPIFFDGLGMLGKEAEPPAWLENDSLVGWLITLAVGAVFFGVGLGVSYVLGWVPSAAADWLPRAAGNELLHYFMIAVTVIVVAVPEGLAMSVTLSLAYSMRKMTAENNLVRRMHACETIGAATVICSDKTGTLTLNEMRVFEVRLPGLQGPFTVGGAGPMEKLVTEAMAANSTANLGREDGQARALGNPTEGALLLWLDQQQVDYIPPRTDFAIDYQWTFSTERKYMATLGTSPRDSRKILHIKGAPELVLSKCTHWLTSAGSERLSEGDQRSIGEALKEFQQRGMRTLGLAFRHDVNHHDGVDVEHLAGELTWLGFVAIADPIRPEVPPAIAMCRQAGVQVKMVTGDNPETAQEIARQIGLWDATDGPERHLAGRDFQALDEGRSLQAAQDLKVLSRARPMDKLKLVRLLQEREHVVAVTGDGTNDAPALNHANVGLAMGKTGTAVAKEASDIILLDDSFRSILNAIMWGRSLYQNIQRFILFQLTINVAALVIAFLGPFIGIKFPLTVTQMLWVNLIMDTFAALALATEPAHGSVLRRPPRNRKDFIVTPQMGRAIFGVAAVFLVVLIAMLIIVQTDGVVSGYELSVFFSVFVLLQFWNLFNARCLGQTHSAFTGLLENPAFLVIALAILVGQILLVQFGGAVFRTEPLSLRDWLLIIALTSLVLWLGELYRFALRKKGPLPAAV